MFSMITSSFTSTSLFYTQLVGVSNHYAGIRDLRTGCGRWVVYVFMRGREGSVARFGPGLSLWIRSFSFSALFYLPWL